MKNILEMYKFALIGTILGAIIGYLYWRYIGCESGTCLITSSPLKTTLVCAVLGGFLLDTFKPRRKK